jgi:hypothetical protein
MRIRVWYLLLFFCATIFCYGQEQAAKPQDQSPQAGQQLQSATAETGSLAVSKTKIHSGSKIYIAPMEAGFENFVIAGFQKKKVPLTVVIDKTKADYEMTGIAESEKAGWAKMLFMGSQQSKEQASVKVSDLKTGAVVFAYSVHKSNSYKGKQSAGEACAKHIKEVIE